MSIIQTIRDKGAKISVALIALALIGFILTDYFSGKNRSRGGSATNSIGSVNGVNVSYDEFQVKVKQLEDNMRQQGYPESPATAQQAQENAWYTQVNQLILQGEIDKLGMSISAKELGDILYGPQAPEDLKKQFTDSATGQYDPVRAKQQIDAMLKSKKTPAAQKENFNTYVSQLKFQRLVEKYLSLFANSSNQPRWYAEKQNSDNSMIGKISYVRMPYADSMFIGSDSTIKISDKEIADYLDKHKTQFQVPEENRTVNYINFSAAPSAADSNEAKKTVALLRPAFDSAKNVEEYLASEGVVNYYDGYKSGKAIESAAKDSIFKLPVGTVYGPYLEGGNYVLAKILGARQMADTAKVRHILIGTTQTDPQSGQTVEIRDSATAYKLADSIRNAIARGSNFDSLCVKFTDDQGSKEKGGVYDKVVSGQMVSEFNDYIFLNPAGSKGIVKTQFGFHYIEILSQKGSGMGYKIAFLPKEISTSQQTDGDALNEATKFAADSRDGVAFDANFEKNLKAKGYNKGIAPNIKANDAQVQGVGFSRAFVRKVYEGKLGEVLKPEKVDQNYVVAVITEINVKGIYSVAKARQFVEPLLRNKKKGEIIVQKIGKVTTLEAAAAALHKQIETVDSLRMNAQSISPALGREPKILGATFNSANKGKVIPEAIVGSNAVYVIRVDSVSTTPVLNGSISDLRKNYYDQTKQTVSSQQGPMNALRNAATINDKRATRF